MIILLFSMLIRPFVVVPVDTAPTVQFLNEEVFESQEGHIKVVWEGGQGPYELQISGERSFEDPKTYYRGQDRACFVSGLENGDHFFRVKQEGGAWSPVLTVKVSHQSLALAFTLFTLGAIVFGLTVFVVVRGARKAERDLAI